MMIKSCVYLYIVFIFVWKARSKKLKAKAKTMEVMPSYYTVEVTGIPRELNDPTIIKNHFEQFGQIYEVNLPKDYGNTLVLHKELSDLSSEIEIEKIKIEVTK